MQQFINGCELSEITPSVKNIFNENIFFGPYNYVQLYGNINNINKNITIFMDVHLDINNQTRCDSFDSSDISQYLYQIIKKTTKTLDFFLEIRKEQIQQPQTDKKDIYIAELIEMFKTEFIIEKDEVRYSKSNREVRLHYLDIRDHLQFNYILNLLKKDIFPKINSIKNDNLTDSDKIIKLKQITQHIEKINKYIMKIFEDKIDIKQHKSLSYDIKSQQYYIDKIIHKYKHETAKKFINDILNKYLLQYFGEFQRIFGIISYMLYDNRNIINMSKAPNLTNISSLCDDLHKNIYELYALITDIYFLRRFLDKDYIQNVITYCGRNHALNYIYFLVKYCNFTITKIYNSNGLTLDDIINKIKDTDDLNKVYNLFLFVGEKPKQCVEKLDNELYFLGW